MIYDIQTKSDFQTGATLVITLPEEDLDKKAFLTINASNPDFLVPFRHRNVDGQIELTYVIGKNSKLLYLTGSFPAKQYADLLHSMLSPLLECEDWFLIPYSFVLNNEYVYYDNDSKTVKYLYVPSVKQVSELSNLVVMINKTVEQIRVTDANLENNVLRALRKDFNPIAFLDLLKPYRSAAVHASGAVVQYNPQPQQFAQQPQVVQQSSAVQASPPSPAASGAAGVSGSAGISGRPDDIFIDLGGDSKGKKEKRVKEQKVKPAPVAKDKKSGSLFGGKKKEQPSSVVTGAAFDAQNVQSPQQFPQPQQTPNYGNVNQPLNIPYSDGGDGATEIISSTPSGTGLRLISRLGSCPERINISVQPGTVFSIGRHSPSIGTKQSDFEFAAKTKEVSRRHAVIERNQGGYSVIDIGSKAGTFVNSNKLIPNVAQPLNHGDRISFGNAGADYVWEIAE